MATKAQKIAGWVLSVMVGGMLIMSSTGKFSPKPDYVQMLEHVGYQAATMPKIGVAELLSALLFLVPQTAFLGAILVTGYMGGAIATHVRVGDPFFVQLAIGVVAWVGFGLRRPEVIRLAFGLKSPE